MVKLFILFLTISLPSLYADESPPCFKDILATHFKSSYRDQIRLKKGKIQDWEQGSKLGLEAIESLTLTLSPEDDLENIAKFFSLGTDHRPLHQKLIEVSKRSGEIDLLEISPDAAKVLTNKVNPFCNDANCHNAVINWENPYGGVRYLDKDDFIFALENRYNLLAEEDELLFGDIIIFGQSDEVIKHSAIYIDDNLVWHKPGLSNSRPYIFQTMDDATKRYFNKKSSFVKFYRRKLKQ